MQKESGKIEDCSTCPDRLPELEKINEDVWKIWNSVGTQWRIGGFSIIGLDYNVVFKMIEFYEIDFLESDFEKLRMLEQEELKRLNKEGDSNE